MGVILITAFTYTLLRLRFILVVMTLTMATSPGRNHSSAGTPIQSSVPLTVNGIVPRCAARSVTPDARPDGVGLRGVQQGMNSGDGHGPCLPG